MFVCLSQARTCISSVMVFFYVQWFQVRGDCLFCWYWWNCWSSLYKLSFHNVFTSGNLHNLFHKKQKLALILRDRRGRDHMVVGFTTTYAICAHHHWCCEFESRSGRGVQHYVIKFVSNFPQVRGFLHQ
jgi:hypothetical protein